MKPESTLDFTKYLLTLSMAAVAFLTSRYLPSGSPVHELPIEKLVFVSMTIALYMLTILMCLKPYFLLLSWLNEEQALDDLKKKEGDNHNNNIEKRVEAHETNIANYKQGIETWGTWLLYLFFSSAFMLSVTLTHDVLSDNPKTSSDKVIEFCIKTLSSVNGI